MKRIINSNNAPEAIGSYSQAVQVRDTVYLSGQIGLQAETMQMVDGGIEAQVKQVFKNLEAVAKEAGGGLSDIAKLTVYLTTMDNYAAVSKIMMQVFDAPYPARSAVAVSALPRSALVEVDAVIVF